MSISKEKYKKYMNPRFYQSKDDEQLEFLEMLKKHSKKESKKDTMKGIDNLNMRKEFLDKLSVHMTADQETEFQLSNMFYQEKKRNSLYWFGFGFAAAEIGQIIKIPSLRHTRVVELRSAVFGFMTMGSYLSWNYYQHKNTIEGIYEAVMQKLVEEESEKMTNLKIINKVN